MRLNATNALKAVGLAIGLAGVVLFSIALTHLLKGGTCASGGPYAIAQQCSSGTGTWMAMLPVGIVASIVGMFIGPAWFTYSALFLVSGITVLVELLTASGVSAGGKLGGYIIAAIFIPMGAVPLILASREWITTRGERSLATSGKVADATVSRVEELRTFGPNEATVRITYAVQPADGASFEVSQTRQALRSRMPAVSGRVRIRYDNKDHNRFEIVGS
jgi:hypothetical protein